MDIGIQDEYVVACLMEHAVLPSRITGSFVDLENLETAFAGVTAPGCKFSKDGKSSIWFAGEMISPLFIDDNGCACKSHIEGIVTDIGWLHFLEQQDAPLLPGKNLFEYLLCINEREESPMKFMGNVFNRLADEQFEPRKIGEALIEMNPFWARTLDSSKSHSMIYSNFSNYPKCLPQFWEQFIRQINSEGYITPYDTV